MLYNIYGVYIQGKQQCRKTSQTSPKGPLEPMLFNDILLDMWLCLSFFNYKTRRELLCHLNLRVHEKKTSARSRIKHILKANLNRSFHISGQCSSHPRALTCPSPKVCEVCISLTFDTLHLLFHPNANSVAAHCVDDDRLYNDRVDLRNMQKNKRYEHVQTIHRFFAKVLKQRWYNHTTHITPCAWLLHPSPLHQGTLRSGSQKIQSWIEAPENLAQERLTLRNPFKCSSMESGWLRWLQKWYLYSNHSKHWSGSIEFIKTSFTKCNLTSVAALHILKRCECHTSFATFTLPRRPRRWTIKLSSWTGPDKWRTTDVCFSLQLEFCVWLVRVAPPKRTRKESTLLRKNFEKKEKGHHLLSPIIICQLVRPPRSVPFQHRDVMMGLTQRCKKRIHESKPLSKRTWCTHLRSCLETTCMKNSLQRIIVQTERVKNYTNVQKKQRNMQLWSYINIINMNETCSEPSNGGFFCIFPTSCSTVLHLLVSLPRATTQLKYACQMAALLASFMQGNTCRLLGESRSPRWGVIHCKYGYMLCITYQTLNQLGERKMFSKRTTDPHWASERDPSIKGEGILPKHPAAIFARKDGFPKTVLASGS